MDMNGLRKWVAKILLVSGGIGVACAVFVLFQSVALFDEFPVFGSKIPMGVLALLLAVDGVILFYCGWGLFSRSGKAFKLAIVILLFHIVEGTVSGLIVDRPMVWMGVVTNSVLLMALWAAKDEIY